MTEENAGRDRYEVQRRPRETGPPERAYEVVAYPVGNGPSRVVCSHCSYADAAAIAAALAR